jgi:methylenetetrahydrofolate--tRNA-(uracil-5-)-methyltransferase
MHAECAMAGSLIMSCADANQVPAGSALAVDRKALPEAVTNALEAHPLITIAREEVAACRRKTGTASSSQPVR